MSSFVRGGGGKTKIETEEKTVTAATTNKVVTPSEGKFLSKVTVQPTPTEEKNVVPGKDTKTVLPSAEKHLSQVTVQGDEELIPGNIKKGISIFGTEGTLESGIVPLAFDANGYVTKAKVYGTKLPAGIFARPYKPGSYSKADTGYMSKSLNELEFVDEGIDVGEHAFENLSPRSDATIIMNFKVKNNTIGKVGTYAFYECTCVKFDLTKPFIITGNIEFYGLVSFRNNLYGNGAQPMKIKFKGSKIANMGVAHVFNCGETKVWISSNCRTIEEDGFYNSKSGIPIIYCEPSSQPSGWHGSWRDGNSIKWGISESAFDAL